MTTKEWAQLRSLILSKMNGNKKRFLFSNNFVEKEI